MSLDKVKKKRMSSGMDFPAWAQHNHVEASVCVLENLPLVGAEGGLCAEEWQDLISACSERTIGNWSEHPQWSRWEHGGLTEAGESELLLGRCWGSGSVMDEVGECLPMTWSQVMERKEGKESYGWLQALQPLGGWDGLAWPLLLRSRDSVDQGQEPCIGHGESELTVGHSGSFQWRWQPADTVTRVSRSQGGAWARDKRLGPERAYLKAERGWWKSKCSSESQSCFCAAWMTS